MTANQWLKTPKGYVATVLAACLFIAAIGSFSMKGIGNAFVAVVVCAAFDMLCGRIVGKKRNVPDGAIITGLIVALVLSVTSSWFIVAATCVIAILSKYLLSYKKKPIFNPAAFGLLLSILLLRTGQSWWGAFGDLPAWTIGILLIGGYFVTNRVNKFPLVLSYLATYFTLMLIMGLMHVGDAVDALRPPFINASLFFALFMLTDPPTSPAKDKEQIFFGVLSAAVGSAVYGLFGGLMYLFIGLFVGNLYHLMRARSAALRDSRVQDHRYRRA